MALALGLDCGCGVEKAGLAGQGSPISNVRDIGGTQLLLGTCTEPLQQGGNSPALAGREGSI